MTGERAAFFDVDGTLRKGLTIVEFPIYLAERGYFDRTVEREIRELARQHERGKVGYHIISSIVPRLYATGIRGQSQNEVMRLATEFMRHSRERFFPYSAKLISMMCRHRFITIAISGSPVETVLPLRGMGFIEIHGSMMGTLGGKYTGELRTNLCIAEEKGRLLGALIRKHRIDAARSFAFGDTEQDLPVLEAVGTPIALNPNANLRRHAAERGWLTPHDVVRVVASLL